MNTKFRILILGLVFMLLLSGCAAKGTVTGRVLLNGTPLSGEEIALSSQMKKVSESQNQGEKTASFEQFRTTTKTDANGVFTFEEIKAGTYSLVFVIYTELMDCTVDAPGFTTIVAAGDNRIMIENSKSPFDVLGDSTNTVDINITCK